MKRSQPLTRKLNDCPHCRRVRRGADTERGTEAPAEAGSFDRAQDGLPDLVAELRRNFRYDPGLEWAEAVGP